MKSSSFALFLVFSFLLVANNVCHGRKDQGEYWKDVMDKQTMPEAIKDLLVEDPQVSSSHARKNKDQFMKDFDIKPNVILYHSHVGPKKQKA
ncbi:hypothetical protein HN51_023643 [Arachis hypogaea]|uniref:Organ-specific protein P4 n=1 Tax=Arachis hypogaea TaxID=3818 RepID=A0A445C316_ARAHY|nr:Organ-specific protein [Arachis hypogaea]RYR45310.1 hypothetical protein Ahy_A07g031146 [Arachis hypogaea]